MQDMKHYMSAWENAAVLDLVSRGIEDAKKEGFLSNVYHVELTNELVVAYRDSLPVAFIFFEEFHSLKEFWINFGYCLPPFRRTGAYRSCIEMLRVIAFTRGFDTIHTAALPYNKVAIASILARGGTLQAVEFSFPVNPSNQ